MGDDELILAAAPGRDVFPRLGKKEGVVWVTRP